MENSQRSTETCTLSSILTRPWLSAFAVSTRKSKPMPTPARVTPKARTLTLAEPLSPNR